MKSGAPDDGVTRLEFARAMAGIYTTLWLVFSSLIASPQPWLRLMIMILVGGASLYYWLQVHREQKRAKEQSSDETGDRA
jgi:hypothetical protein